MRIQRLETYTRRNLSLVKVITDDGAQGIGQISPYDADISALVFHRLVAPVALGKDPMDLDMLVDRILVEVVRLRVWTLPFGT
jgi:L-alanine-DL-glutamate epimerase-like enolase superfamily enzyme